MAATLVPANVQVSEDALQSSTHPNQPSAGDAPYGSAVLWVDTLCQMRDGRICSVDEYDLINCH